MNGNSRQTIEKEDSIPRLGEGNSQKIMNNNKYFLTLTHHPLQTSIFSKILLINVANPIHYAGITFFFSCKQFKSEILFIVITFSDHKQVNY